ncbi:LLM class flavin-dependent oxidoreductase [Actinoallomurus purpureus]|nr:LLM class flavin-dependent oxidoreductase [Actinoallomurus purpureus]
MFDRRGLATDEAIRILRSVWTTSTAVGFEGDVYRFEPMLMEPKPARPGGLPIWIGGHGKRSIRRAAELGDGWLPFRLPVDELTKHLAYLREQLALYGRRREDVTVAVNVVAHPSGSDPGGHAADWDLVGDADACAEKLRRYQQAGVEHFLVKCPHGSSTAAMVETYEVIAREVRPRLERNEQSG